MKTQFKTHIKSGSGWYDNFFKVSRRHQARSSQTVENREAEQKKPIAYTEENPRPLN